MEKQTDCYRIMAQQQLGRQPLEIKNMWHLSDNDGRRERTLPSAKYKKITLRRRLATLEEDLAATDRFRQRIQDDIIRPKGQLVEQK